jgi:hypothetical protein
MARSSERAGNAKLLGIADDIFDISYYRFQIMRLWEFLEIIEIEFCSV